jgi:hypothetical protein
VLITPDIRYKNAASRLQAQRWKSTEKGTNMRDQRGGGGDFEEG